MGLDTSHGCWHGAYSAFHRWRVMLARVAGLPPLDLMEGMYEARNYRDPLHWAEQKLGDGSFADIYAALPIRWDSLRYDPALYALLHHSDCDGEIPAEMCGPLADRLTELLPLITGDGGGHIGDYREKTATFISGLRLAESRNEPVEFG